MFILNLTYIKSMKEVDNFLSEHIQYLEKYYELNKFICSGRKNPRTGGIILCNATNRKEAEKIVSEDPFFIQKIAKYEIIEFIPTKCDEKFKTVLLKN